MAQKSDLEKNVLNLARAVKRLEGHFKTDAELLALVQGAIKYESEIHPPRPRGRPPKEKNEFPDMEVLGTAEAIFAAALTAGRPISSRAALKRAVESGWNKYCEENDNDLPASTKDAWLKRLLTRLRTRQYRDLQIVVCRKSASRELVRNNREKSRF